MIGDGEINWFIYFLSQMLIIILSFIYISLLTPKTEDKFMNRNSCEILKGIAILGVMLCHFMGTFGVVFYSA